MTAAGEPLALAHGDELRPLLAAVRCSAAPPPGTLSDASFANLLLFRDAHDWRLLRGRWPCISGHAYDGARLLLPLFDLAAAPVHELRALLQGHDAFGPLDDAQLARLDPSLFSASHSRDDADYLYSADQFRHYRGTLLQKKANLARQLRALHEVLAEPYRPALAGQAALVLQGWLHDKAKNPGDTDDGPCLQALQQADVLGLHGLLFRIGGQPAGFVLAEPLAPGVVVMRFAKALDAYKGLYQHMFQHYAIEHADVQWINFEQDLGLANFRLTKLSYQPVQLLAKHRVRVR